MTRPGSRLRAAYGRIRKAPLVGPLAQSGVGRLRALLETGPASSPSAYAASDLRADLTGHALDALLSRVRSLETRAGPVAPPAADDASNVSAPLPASVVICTLDRASWLARALSAVSRLRHPNYEVIVVNGPSRDCTASVLAAYRDRVRVGSCPVANLSASRNIGIGLARGEVVAFLDDDAAPEPDWLDHLLAPYADPGVGGVGGVIRDRSGVSFQVRAAVADRLGRSWAVEDAASARADPPGPGVERYLSLTGANSSFRRSALLQIGGFDEAYSYFLDETDVCLRLAEAGWTLAWAPDAEVHHEFAESRQRRPDRTPRSLKETVRSTAYFALRNGAPRHGMASALIHLQAYGRDLAAEQDRRLRQGRINAALQIRLVREIEQGLAEGVREALSTPDRRLARLPAASLLSGHEPRPQPRCAQTMRLCLLSQDYPPGEAGGIGVWTAALAQALVQAGHEVTVVTRSRDQTATVRLEAGVWVHRVVTRPEPVPASPALAGLPPAVAAYAQAAHAELARIEPRRRFQLVMGPLWDLEPLAVMADGRWPVAVSLHTAYAQVSPHKPEWAAAPRYRRSHVEPMIAAERRLLGAAPHILANSEAIVRDLARLYDAPDLARRVQVIPHGLPDLARDQVTPRSAHPTLLFVGRLELRKGIDTLLEAAPAILAASPDLRLVIAGDDRIPVNGQPLRRRFETRHAGASWLSRIEFTGQVSRERLLRLYAGCDLVAAPSRYESFGLVPLEAMVFCKPVVACDTGGVGEVVRDGETGLLVPPGDAAALVAAVLSLLRDPERAGQMGRAGRRRYEACFTDKIMADAVEDWVRAILAGRELKVAAE